MRSHHVSFCYGTMQMYLQGDEGMKDKIISPITTSRGKVIIVGCTVLFVLSAIDGVLTLWGIGLGTIEEANPAMLWLIEKSPFIFMALSLPLILGLVSWRLRNKSRWLVKYGLGLVLVVYALVTLSHAYWIIRAFLL